MYIEDYFRLSISGAESLLRCRLTCSGHAQVYVRVRIHVHVYFHVHAHVHVNGQDLDMETYLDTYWVAKMWKCKWTCT
jgi:hypothetical protein